MYSALSEIVQFDVSIYKSEHRRSKTIGNEGSVYYIIYVIYNKKRKLIINFRIRTELINIKQSED